MAVVFAIERLPDVPNYDSLSNAFILNDDQGRGEGGLGGVRNLGPIAIRGP